MQPDDVIAGWLVELRNLSTMIGKTFLLLFGGKRFRLPAFFAK